VQHSVFEVINHNMKDDARCLLNKTNSNLCKFIFHKMFFDHQCKCTIKNYIFLIRNIKTILPHNSRNFINRTEPINQQSYILNLNCVVF